MATTATSAPPISYLRYGVDTIVDPDTGQPTSDFVNAWNAMVDRLGVQVTNKFFGVINGVNQAAAAAAAAQATANAAKANAAAAATASGVTMTATFDADAFSIITGPGLAATNIITVTPSGGTPPYTYVYTLGTSTFTMTHPGGTNKSQFSVTLADGDGFYDVVSCAVSDSAAHHYTVTAGVSAYSISGNILP